MKKNLFNKLFFPIISLIILSFISIFILSYFINKNYFTQNYHDSLVIIRNMQKLNIEKFFKESFDDLNILSQDMDTINSFKELKQAYNLLSKDLNIQNLSLIKEDVRKYYDNIYLKNLKAVSRESKDLDSFIPSNPNGLLAQYLYTVKNPYKISEKSNYIKSNDNSLYSKIHEQRHSVFKKFAETNYFSDLLLIDHETGDIIYSVNKNVDFGSNIFKGFFKSTELELGFKQVINSLQKDFVYLVDFNLYDPFYFKPVMFIITPIFDNMTKVGVIIAQISVDVIDKITSFDSQWEKLSLGKSGYVYFVSNTDFKLRSDPRFFLENSEQYYKFLEKVSFDPLDISKIKLYNSAILLDNTIARFAARDAFDGKVGVNFNDKYYNKEVVTAYDKINLKNLTWAIIVQMDKDEIFTPFYLLYSKVLIFYLILFLIILLIIIFYAKNFTNNILLTGPKGSLLILKDHIYMIEKILKQIYNNINNFSYVKKINKDLDTAREPLSKLEELSDKFSIYIKVAKTDLKQIIDLLNNAHELGVKSIEINNLEKIILNFKKILETIISVNSINNRLNTELNGLDSIINGNNIALSKLKNLGNQVIKDSNNLQISAENLEYNLTNSIKELEYIIKLIDECSKEKSE